jgi:hypothetical protein
MNDFRPFYPMKAPIAQSCGTPLGLPLWSHLTVTGNFNLNMMLKIELKKNLKR